MDKSKIMWKYALNAVTVWILLLLIGIRLLLHMGYAPYRILTGSMEPVLQTGEVVLIDTDDREIEPGEIIAFWEGTHVVIHRVQEIKSNDTYITKGDANPTIDFNPVDQRELIGSLWIRLGGGTKIWDIFSSNIRYVLLAVLLVLHGILEYRPEKCGGENGNER